MLLILRKGPALSGMLMIVQKKIIVLMITRMRPMSPLVCAGASVMCIQL